ncbi:hypothetical protein RC1_2228 [Rhodospirillum centenum SW]|uniref:Uncharacterized protein n=1 Tax=Rhodospirillum centenum (strain ATCC 51521 / SW) TaxID=414684 RepID=B6IPB3_RHOCS|nr:hypothetical protein RC1_2228 [Rhodospirillum centenum SW]
MQCLAHRTNAGSPNGVLHMAMPCAATARPASRPFQAPGLNSLEFLKRESRRRTTPVLAPALRSDGQTETRPRGPPRTEWR